MSWHVAQIFAWSSGLRDSSCMDLLVLVRYRNLLSFLFFQIQTLRVAWLRLWRSLSLIDFRCKRSSQNKTGTFSAKKITYGVHLSNSPLSTCIVKHMFSTQCHLLVLYKKISLSCRQAWFMLLLESVTHISHRSGCLITPSHSLHFIRGGCKPPVKNGVGVELGMSSAELLNFACPLIA